MEEGTADSVYHRSAHPFTLGLLNSVPRLDLELAGDLAGALGDAPDPSRPPDGCRFHTRCPEVFEPCTGALPPMFETGGRPCRCFLYDPEHRPRGRKKKTA